MMFRYSPKLSMYYTQNQLLCSCIFISFISYRTYELMDIFKFHV